MYLLPPGWTMLDVMAMDAALLATEGLSLDCRQPRPSDRKAHMSDVAFTPDLMTSPRRLSELSEEVTDAKVNLTNAVGSPAVGPPQEVAAAERLALAERAYQDAIAFGNFIAPPSHSAMLGIPATPQPSVAAQPTVSVADRRESEPMPPETTEADLVPIPPIDKLPEPPNGGKGRGRPPREAKPSGGIVDTGDVLAP